MPEKRWWPLLAFLAVPLALFAWALFVPGDSTCRHPDCSRDLERYEQQQWDRRTIELYGPD